MASSPPATPTCSGTPPEVMRRDAADDGENACSAMLTRIASSMRACAGEGSSPRQTRYAISAKLMPPVSSFRS